MFVGFGTSKLMESWLLGYSNVWSRVFDAVVSIPTKYHRSRWVNVVALAKQSSHRRNTVTIEKHAIAVLSKQSGLHHSITVVVKACRRNITATV